MFGCTLCGAGELSRDADGKDLGLRRGGANGAHTVRGAWDRDGHSRGVRVVSSFG
jgi:hypothetical protein